MTEIQTQTEETETIPFYPDHVRTEFKVVVGLLLAAVIVGALGLFFPVGLGEPADPMNTPTHIKPEWYFLSLYQLLKFIPKTTGVLIPIIAMAVLAIWPFLDRKPDRSPKSKRIRLAAVLLICILIAALTVWGEVS
jgi:quinol-cytochrome oxidoreductase complex cytochrome b subunit